MIRKNIFFEDEQVEKINDLMANHPEISTFSAAIRWMIQTYQEPIAEEKSSNDAAINQRKLMAMSKEEALQTQLMVSLLTEFKVHVVGDVTENPVYIAAKSEADKRLNQAMTDRKIFGNE